MLSRDELLGKRNKNKKEKINPEVSFQEKIAKLRKKERIIILSTPILV